MLMKKLKVPQVQKGASSLIRGTEIPSNRKNTRELRLFKETHEDTQAMIFVHKCTEEKQEQGRKLFRLKPNVSTRTNECKVTISTFRLILKGIE